MNDGLKDCIGHNTWATAELLKLSSSLTDAQLDATAIGTYGSIIETFRHIIRSEAGYQARLMGSEPDWDRQRLDSSDLAELASRNNDLSVRWQQFLSDPFDAEKTFPMRWHDGLDRDVPAGVVLAQAIHHGSDHRSQICTILTMLDMTVPPMGLWDWAEATNRARQRESR
jgi:uncharacterized damage-inducible protein DinB